MKIFAALAFVLCVIGGGPLQAQVFQLPPERDPNEALAKLSCLEIDQEIEKARKYIALLNSDVSMLGGDAETPPGQFAAEDGLARGEALDRANDRLNALESVRLNKDCPGTIPD